MRHPMVDLTRVPDEQLRREWHALLGRGQVLGIREDVAAIETELIRRSWDAPSVERER